MQELLAHAKQEILSTTRLPMAIDFLLTELRHIGTMSTAMARLSHYFTAFQTYVMQEAEAERGRFDLRVAVDILRHEASCGQSADLTGLLDQKAPRMLPNHSARIRAKFMDFLPCEPQYEATSQQDAQLVSRLRAIRATKSPTLRRPSISDVRNFTPKRISAAKTTLI